MKSANRILTWSLWLVSFLAILLAPLPAMADSEREMDAAFEQAQQLYNSAKYPESAALYEKALGISQKLYGENHVNTANVLNNLAMAYHAQGKYAQAEAMHLRCLANREAALGMNHASVGASLNNLAILCRDLGKFTQAESLYLRSLRINEAAHGKDHPNVADGVNNLAILYSDLGRYSQAETLFVRSLKIREASLGGRHPSVADSLNNLGQLYRDLGKFPEAEQLYLLSLQIREGAKGKDHPGVAAPLNNLANLYWTQGKYAQAEPLYLRSLAIRETVFGKDHPDVAQSLNGLANLYKSKLEFARAEPLYQRILKMRETFQGKDHPDVATALVNLAIVYQAQKKFAEAEPLLQRGLAIKETVLGRDHPDVAASLASMVLQFAEQGKFKEAVPHETRLRQASRKYFLREFPYLSPREQQNFIDQKETARFAMALTLGLRLAGDETVAVQSAEWLLNAKAVGLEAQAMGTILERQADPTLLWQLNDLRGQESVLALRVADPRQRDALLKQRDELQAVRRALEKRIALAGGASAELDRAWVEIDAVRKAIPKECVLIEIARFQPIRYGAKYDEKRWDPARYVAWVIPPGGVVKMVDLGEAEPIEAALKQVRTVIASSPKRIKEIGEKQASAELTEHSQKLSDLVLKPLLPHVDKAKQLILSPDGELWLAPWAALPVAKDRFLVEDFSLRYVISGRDLLAAPPGKQLGTSPALMLADPDFDAGPGAAGTAKGGNDRGLSNDIARLPQFARLPGTAAEAETVGPRMQLLTGSAPTLFTDDKATEAVVKTAKRPKMLTLSTHGFFLPTQVTETKDRDRGEGSRSASLTKEGQPVENPLLRCGLLLAGCNRRSAAKPGEDDGVLTGLEITGIDLRGCEIVVLSACETGLGDIRSGEGVAGLRQAFQLAGAETVVASLWQVPDRDTALLMARFFDNLAAKKGKAEALREAQIGMIKQRRERGDAAHPYFWAAFTVTGGE